jgi:putative ABC transport system permease protein
MLQKILLKKTARELWRRKGTVFALLGVVAIGVGYFVGAREMYLDLKIASTTYYARNHIADFEINLKRAPVSIVDRLARLPNIQQLRWRVRTDTMVMLPTQSYEGKLIHPIPAVAVSMPSPHSPVLNDIELHTGRWFSHPEADEVIVEGQFARAVHIVPGDRIAVRLLDQTHSLLVVGTAYSPEYMMLVPPGNLLAPDPKNYGVLFVPEKMLQNTSDLDGAFNQLIGSTIDASPSAIAETLALLSTELDPYGAELKTAEHDQPSMRMLDDKLQGIQKMTKLYPSIFFLIAILILNVMVNRLVIQQRQAIGTLKALGYNNTDILFHYLCYGAFIGLLGGLLGLLVGYLLHQKGLEKYQQYMELPTLLAHPYYLEWIKGVGLSIGGGLLGAYSAARRAMRLEPAEAMRPPVPEKMRHIPLEHWQHFWQTLSFSSKMSLRAIFRNPFRSLTTILASAAATMLLLSALLFVDSIHKIERYSFDLVQHQDFWLALRNPLGPSMMRSYQLIPGVRHVETLLEIPAQLTHGPYEKLINITGLSPSLSLYTPINDQGTPITTHATGLILSDFLARALHVSLGDTLTLRPLLGDRETVNVPVTQIIPTYFGLSAYIDQSWLSRRLGDSWLANRILLQWNKSFPENGLIHTTRDFAPMINLLSTTEVRQTFVNLLDTSITFFVVLMLLFSGIIAVGTLINTAIISLSERERDIASLRVLGFSHIQVVAIFFKESLLLNGIGTLLGLLLGTGLMFYFSTAFSSEVFRIPAVFRWIRLLEAIGVMALFLMITQGILYRVIRKMDWFEVLNVRE